MSGFFVPSGNINGDEVIIDGSDVNHIKNVLRKKAGDEIMVNDSAGTNYRCRIENISDRKIVLQVLSSESSAAELPVRISLFQGLPKADKMELIIQKAVELGVFDIYPVINERCVVKLDDKKATSKVERWNKISESAAKQSGRGIIPEIHMPINFSDALLLAENEKMNIILPYENADGMKYAMETVKNALKTEKTAVFIGPEGGFGSDEIELAKKKGAKIISLGHRILRTETAGLFLLSVLGFEIECDINDNPED